MVPRETFSTHDRLCVDEVARLAAASPFQTFKSSREGADLARRYGVCEAVASEALTEMLETARTCHWCCKSLGSKQNACFTHIQLLALGHPHATTNICVTCLACARERMALCGIDPAAFQAVRSFRGPSSYQHKDPITQSRDEQLSALHGERVYALQGDGILPWVFATFGLAAYEERLRHLKLSHHDPSLRLHSSGETAPGFKGLVIWDVPTGERFLKEIQRAGDVLMFGA